MTFEPSTAERFAAIVPGAGGVERECVRHSDYEELQFELGDRTMELATAKRERDQAVNQRDEELRERLWRDLPEIAAKVESAIFEERS